MTIKLQINNSGAWKTVVETTEEAAQDLRDHIQLLSLLDVGGWKKTQWRQIDTSGQMQAYWRAGHGWEVKRHA